MLIINFNTILLTKTEPTFQANSFSFVRAVPSSCHCAETWLRTTTNINSLLNDTICNYSFFILCHLGLHLSLGGFCLAHASPWLSPSLSEPILETSQAQSHQEHQLVGCMMELRAKDAFFDNGYFVLNEIFTGD